MAAMMVLALVVLAVAIIFRIYVEYTYRHFHIDYSSAKGKVFVITGGNSGIGLETALRLTQAGGDVVIGCRNEVKCAEAVNSIKNIAGFFINFTYNHYRGVTHELLIQQGTVQSRECCLICQA